jgi:hypothetical protein
VTELTEGPKDTEAVIWKPLRYNGPTASWRDAVRKPYQYSGRGRVTDLWRAIDPTTLCRRNSTCALPFVYRISACGTRSSLQPRLNMADFKNTRLSPCLERACLTTTARIPAINIITIRKSNPVANWRMPSSGMWRRVALVTAERK